MRLYSRMVVTERIFPYPLYIHLLFFKPNRSWRKSTTSCAKRRGPNLDVDAPNLCSPLFSQSMYARLIGCATPKEKRERRMAPSCIATTLRKGTLWPCDPLFLEPSEPSSRPVPSPHAASSIIIALHGYAIQHRASPLE